VKMHHVVLAGVAILSIANLGMWLFDHANTSDIERDLTPYVAGQNNLYPNGTISTVGTRAAAPRFATSIATSNGWEQGGRSSVTHSTGTWAA